MLAHNGCLHRARGYLKDPPECDQEGVQSMDLVFLYHAGTCDYGRVYTGFGSLLSQEDCFNFALYNLKHEFQNAEPVGDMVVKMAGSHTADLQFESWLKKHARQV